MGTDNENVEVLIAKVAELIDILLEAFPLDVGSDIDNERAMLGLERYAQQVEEIAVASEACEFLGLYNVCMLYQELLHQLTRSGEWPGEPARIALEEWPTLVMGLS